MVVVIHANANLEHQRKQAESFRKGFLKHNLRTEITTSITTDADVHVVLGSNYAKNYWLGHDRVVLLDRCYYNDNGENLSVGWMNKKGGRDFKVGEGRPGLTIRECFGTKSIFLADYNGETESADIVRLHPCNEKHEQPLTEVLKQCNRATGYNTSALVTAALEGLNINCKGEQSILSDPNWLALLPYANWNYNEIESGKVWAHLQR